MASCSRSAKRGGSWPQVWVLMLALGALLSLTPAPASSHPNALSRVDVHMKGVAARVELDLDGTSCVDLVQRQLGLAEPPALDAMRAHQARLLRYVDEELNLSADGLRCKRQSPLTQSLSRAKNRLYLRADYRCPRAARRVALRSQLFSDEATPHRIMGGVHQAGRFQRALLEPEREVVFDLASLPHQEDHVPSFHMATPPPRLAGPTSGVATRDAMSTSRHEPLRVPLDAPAITATGIDFWSFVTEGWRHILGGYDHLLFVLALVLGAATLRDLAKWITTFTIAHSASLALSALELVKVSPRLVEPLIALSIVWVGIETLRGVRRHQRLALVFGFGLLHGLGFGGALWELGLSRGEILIPLLGFNVGVELGQLAVVAPCFALLVWQRKRHASWSVPLRTWASAGLSVLAAVWFFQRALA